MKTPIAVVVLGLAVVVGWKAFDTVPDYATVVVADPETSWEETTELFHDVVGPEFATKVLTAIELPVTASTPGTCPPDTDECDTNVYAVTVRFDTAGSDEHMRIWLETEAVFEEHGYEAICRDQWGDSGPVGESFSVMFVSEDKAPILAAVMAPQVFGDYRGQIGLRHRVAPDGVSGFNVDRFCKEDITEIENDYDI